MTTFCHLQSVSCGTQRRWVTGLTWTWRGIMMTIIQFWESFRIKGVVCLIEPCGELVPNAHPWGLAKSTTEASAGQFHSVLCLEYEVDLLKTRALGSNSDSGALCCDFGWSRHMVQPSLFTLPVCSTYFTGSSLGELIHIITGQYQALRIQ